MRAVVEFFPSALSLSHSINFPFFFNPSFCPPPREHSIDSRMAEETVVVADVVAAVPSEGGAEGAETVVVIGEL